MPEASVVKALSTKTIFYQTKLMNPEAMEALGKKNIKNAILVSGVRTLYFFMFLFYPFFVSVSWRLQLEACGLLTLNILPPVFDPP